MAKRRPQIHALECVKFKATSQRVGINWGTGMYSFSSLAVYSDRDCKQMIGHVEGYVVLVTLFEKMIRADTRLVLKTTINLALRVVLTQNNTEEFGLA